MKNQYEATAMPATLMVRANEGPSYADVLKNVKKQECFHDVEVTAARKTAAGFLLLQFARETRQGQIDKVEGGNCKGNGKCSESEQC